MPGARMVMIVTRKFSAVAIDDAPGELHADREERPGRSAPSSTAARRPSSPMANEPPGAKNDASIIDAGDRQQPERQRVQARERHVRRADHQRQDVVRQPGEDRDDEQEDQDRRVDAEQAVVGVRVDELAARARRARRA